MTGSVLAKATDVAKSVRDVEVTVHLMDGGRVVMHVPGDLDQRTEVKRRLRAVGLHPAVRPDGYYVLSEWPATGGAR